MIPARTPRADTGCMRTISLTAVSARTREAIGRHARAWPATAIFAALALLYCVLDVLGGRIAAPVALAALATLFVVTPVGACACRAVASRRWRALGTLALAFACAAMWCVLMLLYFDGADRHDPDRTRIVRAAASGALLYFPVAWLACGGLRLDEATGVVARTSPRVRIVVASVEALFWLAVAYAVVIAWSRWGRPLDVARDWGPMSILVFEAAVLASVLDAIRAVRHGPWYVLGPVVLVAAWLAWLQWWMMSFDLMVASVAH